MNINTGELFPSRELAIAAGHKPEAIVEISGTPEAITKVSAAVRAANARRQKMARESRRRNRKK